MDNFIFLEFCDFTVYSKLKMFKAHATYFSFFFWLYSTISVKLFTFTRKLVLVLVLEIHGHQLPVRFCPFSHDLAKNGPAVGYFNEIIMRNGRLFENPHLFIKS